MEEGLKLAGDGRTREGAARVRLYLCAIELHGHRQMLGELELILAEVRLTPEQARAVCEEIQARRALIKEAERGRTNAHSSAWYQRHKARGAGVRSYGTRRTHAAA